MMAILKEEARKAGVDFVLDGLDHTVLYKKEMAKEHQMVFSAWGFRPPYPRYYEYFHSNNAYDDKGNLKTRGWISWPWRSGMQRVRMSLSALPMRCSRSSMIRAFTFLDT